MTEQTHSHPCHVCGARVPCEGQMRQNFDGWPHAVCELYHLGGGHVVLILCDECMANLDLVAE